MEASGSSGGRLIDDYLREIRVSAWNRGVPRTRVASLVTEVRAKIEAALSAAGSGRDEAAAYSVLDRLGPPSAFVVDIADEPRSGARGVLDRALAPFARLGYVHGWGLAEIGSLLLLIVGPFLLWWIGPGFGIMLVRARANRWTTHATHRATVFVVVLFAAQVLVAVGLFVSALMSGGPLATLVQRTLASFGPAGGGHLFPLPIFGELSPLGVLLTLPAFVAGIGSGIYLALSPRQRARPMN